MSVLGVLLPAASIGFGALLLRPRRGFFPFNEDGESLAPILAQATVSESHTDELEITEHPIEQGAAISDHAYKRPSVVVIRCGWSNSPSGSGSIFSQAVGVGSALGGSRLGVLASLPSTIKAAQSLLSGNDESQVKAIYNQLLDLQASRIPFDILTGKKTYRNMLFQSLTTETSQATENSLMIVAICREVLIVSTRVVAVPANAQANPEKTNPPLDLGPRSLFNPPNFQPPNIPGFLGNFLP